MQNNQLDVKYMLNEREKLFNKLKFDLETQRHTLMCEVNPATASLWVILSNKEKIMLKIVSKALKCIFEEYKINYIFDIVQVPDIANFEETLNQTISSYLNNTLLNEFNMSYNGANIKEINKLYSLQIGINILDYFIKENNKAKKMLNIKDDEIEK